MNASFFVKKIINYSEIRNSTKVMIFYAKNNERSKNIL